MDLKISSDRPAVTPLAGQDDLNHFNQVLDSLSEQPILKRAGSDSSALEMLSGHIHNRDLQLMRRMDQATRSANWTDILQSKVSAQNADMQDDLLVKTISKSVDGVNRLVNQSS